MLITFSLKMWSLSTFPPSYPLFYVNLCCLNFTKLNKFSISGNNTYRLLNKAFTKENCMVKGVSKTVIVVNNTGSRYFEKVVFYVTPEYGNLSQGHLNTAAAKFISTYDFSSADKGSLRKRHKIRKLRLSVALLFSGLLLLGIVLGIIL